MIHTQAHYDLTKHWAERFEQHADALEVASLAPGFAWDIRPILVEVVQLALTPAVAPKLLPILVEAARSAARRLREALEEYDRRKGDHDRE